MSEKMMEGYVPVGKRTRLQFAMDLKMKRKKQKLARIAAKNEVISKQKNAIVVSDIDPVLQCDGGGGEDDEEEAAVPIDESEFNRRVCLFECNPNSPENYDLGMREYEDLLQLDYVNDEVNAANSDDSLQFLGERWNYTGVEDDSEDDDDDGAASKAKTEVSGEKGDSSSNGEDGTDFSDRDFGVEKADDMSSTSESETSDDDFDEDFGERKIVRYKDKNVAHVRIAYDDDEEEFEVDGSGPSRLLKGEKRRERRKRKARAASSGELVWEGDEAIVVVQATPAANAPKEKFVGAKTSSKQNSSFYVKKYKRLAFDCPVTVDGSSSPQSRPDGEEPKFRSRSVNEDSRVHSRPDGEDSRSKPRSRDEDSDKEGYEDRVRMRPDRLSREEDIDLEERMLHKKPRKKKLKVKEVENILLDTILEKGGAEGVAGVASSEEAKEVKEDEYDDICRKFRYGEEEEVEHEKSDDQEELESLFKELEFGLGVCDIGLESHNSSVGGEDEEPAELCESAALQEKLCRKGKHYLILDEEVGIKCKFCSVVTLEIRDVTPDFNENPFGSSKKNYGRLPHENDTSADQFQFPDSNHDFRAAHEDGTHGTVWELIPGVKNTLYEHQQKGFEFIWRNVSGGINIDELEKPSEFGIGGCIICHAPGTGKTRLAIVFLQSYLKQYPRSKPVIIAPSSMLLTWEEEFARWNMHVPFLNLNSPEFSRKEAEVLSCVRNINQRKTIRKAKLCIWAMGRGILGISYTLFEKLAGERKGTDETIKKALLEQSGILFLDEGHTPRNEDSNIWKVFSEVHTKKRVILSGTPFQNNFDELNNTLSIIREEFRDPFLRGNYVRGGRHNRPNRQGFFNTKVDEERRIEKLRIRMKPFVHVHKGEILRKTLRGLFHSVLILNPSELQKKYFRLLEAIKNGLLNDYLVCIASVHPSLLSKCEQVPEFVDSDVLDQHKTDLEAGVKIKFLLELIKLSEGEKVLVFSQFLHPLTFIGELLNSVFKWNEGDEYLLMVGKQRAKQRQSLINLFNDPKSEARVLLASTKACSEGIHLVGASRVVLLDVVWNPSVERQAISRAYRLGQKKDVFVYHLITSGTQEGEKYYRQVAKDRVSEQVFICSEVERGQKTSSSSGVSEDRILEEMLQHEKMKNMFKNILKQPKADKLIESFAPLNLQQSA